MICGLAAMFPAWRVVLTACKWIDALANDRNWYNRTYMTKCRVGCRIAKRKSVTGYMHMAPVTAILDTITEFKAIWCFFVTNRFSEGQPKEQGRREDQTRQFSSTVTCTCRRLPIGVVASIVAIPVTCYSFVTNSISEEHPKEQGRIEDPQEETPEEKRREEKRKLEKQKENPLPVTCTWRR